MRLRLRTLSLAAATVVLTSGCAMYDTRYDYSRLSAGLGDYQESIIDWNFPTSTNQGPLLPPQRFRGYPAAIGVTWATGNPMPWNRTQAPAADATLAGHEPNTCAQDCPATVETQDPGARADARLRDAPSPN